MPMRAQEKSADRAAGDDKSRQRKLVKFFERSRTNWKAKYAETKEKLKQLETRGRSLEKSKAQDKEKVKVKELKRELGQSQQTLEREQKKNSEAAEIAGPAESFEVVVPNHTYSVGHVTLFVSLVLSAPTGLRGASRVRALSMSFFGLSYGAPSWYAERLWLLRLG